MASIRIKFRPSALLHREGVILYQIIASRKVKVITTSFKLFPHEWNNKTCEVILSCDNEKRLQYLLTLQKKIESDYQLLHQTASSLRNVPNEANRIADSYKKKLLHDNLFPFMEGCIQQLKEAGQYKTASTYATTLRSFQKFRLGKDIRLDQLDARLAKEYETWLLHQQILPNTTSFYMRILRAVYNRAVCNGLTAQQFPFQQVYTGVEKTVKRAVDHTIINSLKQIDLQRDPELRFARDLFLFSLYTRGMAFVDIAHLRKKNIINGYLEYKRRKTGQLLRIKIEPSIQQIIDQYAHQAVDSVFLFPILYSTRKYESALRIQNKHLRIISSHLGLKKTLSSYTARHTWASLAKKSKIPIQIISEGMGHESERTTRIYLASLDQSNIDDANAKLLSFL